MAITITFQNTDQIVFQDSKLRKLLPDFQQQFQTWALARQTPELKAMGQKAVIDFLSLVEAKHVKIMEEYFNDKVVVDKIDTNVVANHEFHIDEAEKLLNAQPILKEAFFAYREEDRLYISFWR